VVVYDAGDGSMAAARLWWLLRLIGHANVRVLDGGFAAWQAAGLPVTTELPQVTGLPPYPGHFDRSQIASAEQVQARLKHAPGWLIDARAGERFRGEVEPLDPVAGHVPGAVNRPFALNVHDGRLRPADDLRAALQPLLGTHAPEEVVLMCGSGVTACHLLLAMEAAGLEGARIYADSWSGWVSDPSRPVATG
jgi:thiosulfate/3-mercaptopyruvate sulfurtransferase